MKSGIYDVWDKDDDTYLGREVVEPDDDCDSLSLWTYKWVGPLENCPKSPKLNEEALREQLIDLENELKKYQSIARCRETSIKEREVVIDETREQLNTLIQQVDYYFDTMLRCSQPMAHLITKGNLKALVERYRKERSE